MMGGIASPVSTPAPTLYPDVHKPLSGEGGPAEMEFVFVGEANLDGVRELFQDVLKWSVEHGEEI